MQVQFTMDTSVNGDITALQQLANAFNGSKPSAPPAVNTLAQTEKPINKSAKQETPKASDSAQDLKEMDNAPRVTIEEMRAVAVTKVGKDVKALLTELGQPSVSDFVDDTALRTQFLTRLKELSNK